VKEYSDDAIVLIIEFDSLGSATGLSVNGDGVKITGAMEGGRAVTLPVRLGPGRHEVEIAVRRP
jgi:hypothetical protein